jgi:chromosome segregation ATPase
LSDQLAKVQKDLEQSSRSLQSINTDIQQLENEILNLISPNGSNSRAAMFGRQAPDILLHISRTRFHGEVVGPLGLHIKMKDGYERTQLAVEKSIGRSLSSFIVTNMDDQRLLSAILNQLKCGQYFNISVQHPCSRHAVPPSAHGVTTVADCIHVENDLVFNCLVDVSRIDQTAIAENDEYAQSRLLRIVNGRKEYISSNIKSILLYDGTLILYKGGNESYESNKVDFKKLLAKDMSEVISNLNEQIQSKRVDLQNSMEQHKYISQCHSDVQRAMNEVENSLRNSNIRNRDIIRRKQDLEIKLSDVQALKNIDTSHLESEQDELIEGIESLNRQLDEHSITVESAKKELSILNQEKGLIDRRKQTVLKTISEQERILNNFIDSHENSRRRIEKIRKDVSDKQKEVDKIARDVEKQDLEREGKYHEAIEKTQTLVKNWNGELVLPKSIETPQKLQAMIQSKTLKLNKERQSAGIVNGRTLESVIKKYEQYKTETETTEQRYEKMVANIAMLQGDLRQRQLKWVSTLNANAAIVKTQFLKYMYIKGFKGKVRFDHHERNLYVLVQTDEQDNKTFHDDPRHMSGGEKSFTTLCLLLALGRAVRIDFV